MQQSLNPNPPPSSSVDPSADQSARLSGSVVRITYPNPDNGYCVLKLRPTSEVDLRWRVEQGLVAVVGVMPDVEAGQTIQAGGEWTRDPKFGPQFRVQWYKPELPSGTRGIEVYLGSGAVRGIGPVTAARIVAQFGEQTFDILDNHISRLSEVPGIGPKTRAKIKAGWAAARGDRELVMFLGDHGITPGVAARLRKVYGDNALAVVRSNPYRLTGEVRGIGFARADEIARKIGLPHDAPERIGAALAHVLERQAEEGHTFLPRPRLEELAEQLLKLPRELVTARLDDEIARGRVAVEEQLPALEGESAIFILSLHAAERRVAERIRLLLASPKQTPKLDAVATLADFEQRTRFNLAPAQREAALTLARTGMLILTGGPGTGKTTTVRAIIELFGRAKLRVKLAAPTGRAARRLSETAKLPAETIHRLLGYQAPLARFGRDAVNPIDADLVIIDEASMLDVELAAHLFEALSPRTCLMLVGDEDQLPSVGPGNVLGDLIAAGVMPLVRLTEIFRQARASLIVTNAHRMNQGLLPYFKPPQSGTDEPSAEPDFFFIEREDPFQVVEAIKTLVRDRIPRKFHLDPHHDVQILTPMRRGDLGVDALNAALKALLNPGGGITAAREGESAREGNAAEGEFFSYRAPTLQPGDRVMQTTNNYDKLVFNGDIGHVTRLNAESGEAIIDFDGRAVAYVRDELDQLVPAYAITIHKSQGSEYPAVIVPVHTQHWIMLQRNLLYTALTRARHLAIFIGTRKALYRAIKNADRAKRFTALAESVKRTKEDGAS